MIDQIHLNTATVEELTQLPGIGPMLAERIITYRDTVHPFQEPVEITAVSGISEKMYRAIADRLKTGALHPPDPEEVEEIKETDVTVPRTEPRGESLELEVEPDTPPSPLPPRPLPTQPPAFAPSRTPSIWLGYVKLTAAALLGGLFGALLALLVIGSINGTLDFGQTEAVASAQTELDRLSLQANVLQSDLDGLRQRLDNLEGLTGRMDDVEQAVDGLDEALVQVQSDVDTVNARTDQLNTDIAAVRTVADRFNTFLDGLRDLLFEFQGAPPTPTPTPTATPRPTRTPSLTLTPTSVP
jgi:competence protein ComEA